MVPHLPTLFSYTTYFCVLVHIDFAPRAISFLAANSFLLACKHFQSLLTLQKKPTKIFSSNLISLLVTILFLFFSSQNYLLKVANWYTYFPPFVISRLFWLNPVSFPKVCNPASESSFNTLLKVAVTNQPTGTSDDSCLLSVVLIVF